VVQDGAEVAFPQCRKAGLPGGRQGLDRLDRRRRSRCRPASQPVLEHLELDVPRMVAEFLRRLLAPLDEGPVAS
jgi:hypothetical protein